MAGSIRCSIRLVFAVCLASIVVTGLGCAQTGMIRNHAAMTGKTFMDAISPALDPSGGAFSPQGRKIERSLSRSGPL